MAYIMVDLKNNKKDFDAKKWGEKNKNLAEKAYERWKEDNIKEEPETNSTSTEENKEKEDEK